MTFQPLSEPDYDRQHADPDELEQAPSKLDALLANGWQVYASSCVKPGAPREYRVVLVNRALGRKLFGFGANFEGAFGEAESEWARAVRS